MQFYALWNKTSKSVDQLSGTSHPDMLPAPASNQEWVELQSQSNTLVMKGGKRCEVPIPINPAVALVVAKNARWEAAKQYREAKKLGGCATPLGRVDTRESSRLAIRDNAADASNNLVTVPSWSVLWTMEDDTNVRHSASQMVAMAAAVRAHSNNCQAASQAIRTKIFEATTVAAVNATDITAGYPT